MITAALTIDRGSVTNVWSGRFVHLGRHARFATILGLLATGLTAPCLAETPRLAVMDLRAGNSISAEEARSLTGMLRTALYETGRFTLINREDMEAIAQNHQIELVFCADDACLLEIGSLLGAQKLIAGDVGLVFDEIVVNVRLVDIESRALANERVSSRRIGRSALALQQAMTELAGELAGRLGASPPGGIESNKRKKFSGRVHSVDGDDVLLDVGRWDGLKRGAIFEVVPPPERPTPDGSVGSRKPRLRIVEVFGNYSRARRVTGRGEGSVTAGDAVQALRHPWRVSVEPVVGYLAPLNTEGSEVVRFKPGRDPYNPDQITMKTDARFDGLLLGVSVGVPLTGTIRFYGRSGLIWTHVQTGDVRVEFNDVGGINLGWSELPLGQEGPLFFAGPALRVVLRESPVLALAADVEVLYFPDAVSGAAVVPPGATHSIAVRDLVDNVVPWGAITLRIPIRLYPTRTVGISVSPIATSTLGGSWRCLGVGLQVGPSLEF